MKAIIKAAAIAVALVVPAISFAQTSNGPLTREQVRAQLIELEHAGYNPAHGNRGTYPAEIQAAEARVAATHGGVSNNETTGVGGAVTGTSEVGHIMPNTMDSKSMFGHH